MTHPAGRRPGRAGPWSRSAKTLDTGPVAIHSRSALADPIDLADTGRMGDRPPRACSARIRATSWRGRAPQVRCDRSVDHLDANAWPTSFGGFI